MIDSIRRRPSRSKEIGNPGVGRHQFVSMEKLACLRRRLVVEADSAITAALTHLLKKETERSAIPIQKEIGRRDA